MVGEVFKCVCCREEKNAEESSHDPYLGGLVCDDCRKDLIKATAWLKLYKISRPVEPSDVNQFNFKRFSKELGFQ